MKNLLLIINPMSISLMQGLFIKRSIKATVLCFLILLAASFSISAQTNEPPCGAGFISISSLDNSASESEDILDYHLSIENTGTSTDVFEITTLSIKPEENNPDGSATTENISLKSAIFDELGNQISTLSLQAGKKAELTLRVFIPTGVKTNVWNCTQLKAVSSKCGTESLITYSTYIPAIGAGSVGYTPSFDVNPVINPTAYVCR